MSEDSSNETRPKLMVEVPTLLRRLHVHHDDCRKYGCANEDPHGEEFDEMRLDTANVPTEVLTRHAEEMLRQPLKRRK